MSAQQNHNATIIEQFSQQATVFSQVPGHRESMDLLVQMSEAGERDVVLDVACGPGLVACRFAETAGQVVGVDITSEMIAQAQRLQKEKELSNLEWKIADVESLPYAENEFDVVVTRYSFHHFLSPDEVLAEMIRVCRPGGRVVVADMALPADKADACNHFEKLRDPSHVRALSLPEFEALFAASGLEDIRRNGYAVEIELEDQLLASFPQAGMEKELRKLVVDDIGCDSLGLSAFRRENEVFLSLSHYGHGRQKINTRPRSCMKTLLSRQQGLMMLSLVSLYFIWGSTFLGMRIAIDSFPPFMMAGLRFLSAGALLYGFLWLRGTPHPTLRQWGSAAIVGTLLLAVGNAGVAYAEQWVATGAAALAIATVPLWALIFSALWGDGPHRREWLGIGLGLLGVVILNLGSSMRASSLGATVLLVAAAGWAFGSVWSKRLTLPAGAMSSAAQMLSAGVILMGISAATGEHVVAKPTAKALWAMAYLITFGSFVAYSAYLYLLKTVRPALATSYAFVNPLVAMLLGMWLANERMGGAELLALLAILGGVIVVLTTKRS